ncbi:protein MAIN-LIKE 1-like [Glycine soja]|uniref:protein MAIN-LIKE 1-like n=1 Tax=Glycine soja TaxID=3848 RepID=UPI00103D475C|nr:protein MAIN-LIKE 1-like [Glycine soja]
MVDAATQDTGAETNAQDTGAETDGDELEGFLGGPRDPLVLTEYADHVAGSVWSGQEHLELKLCSHGRKVHNLGRSIPAIEDMVAGTGLSPLIACSIDIGDRGIISSFVERWHRETSSFHLPVGEVSITLDDIASLLHLPIVGAFHDFQPLCTDETVLLLVELLMVSAEVAMTETGQCGGPYVRLQWLRDVYQRRCQTQHWTVAAHAYLLHLLGCTLFANKSATHVHVAHIQALRNLTLAGRYAWRAAGLVHMYDQLNDASLSTSRQFAGYITLLQCWIYEHFPSVAECNADPDYDEVLPRACRWIATKKTVKKLSTATYRQCMDRLRILDACWMPYAEHRPVQNFHPISCFSGKLCKGPAVVRYKLERFMHQFGYIQCIPAHPVHSWVSYDDVDDTWTHYSDHLEAAGDLCVVSGQCAPDYIDWFFVISHPFMTAPQTNPPRDAYAMQPSHIPHEAAPTSTHVDPDANEPRHAVEACHAIAEALEQHLNVLGTSTHEEVIQKCLRIVKSVTEDRNVYVRSRRRRCTDQQ